MDRQTVGNSMKGPLRKVQYPAPETDNIASVLEKWNQNPSSRSEGLIVFLEGGGIHKCTSLQPGSDSCAGGRGMVRKWNLWPLDVNSVPTWQILEAEVSQTVSQLGTCRSLRKEEGCYRHYCCGQQQIITLHSYSVVGQCSLFNGQPKYLHFWGGFCSN